MYKITFEVLLFFFSYLVSFLIIWKMPFILCFEFTYLFQLEDDYFANIVMASALHQHELATGIHLSPPS